jgi:flagellar basal body P-ring formation protein FlgA
MSALRVIAGSLWAAAAALMCLAASSAQAADAQIPVPSVTIYPGQVIEQSMLTDRALRSQGDVRPGTLSSRDAVVGKVARQTLLPGYPIVTGSVREPHVVTQGDSALVMFRSGTLTITVNGVALQSGGAGDTVTVRNTDSGRTIRGSIGEDGIVHVGVP